MYWQLLSFPHPVAPGSGAKEENEPQINADEH
jgi:hypothetical protein